MKTYKVASVYNALYKNRICPKDEEMLPTHCRPEMVKYYGSEAYMTYAETKYC